MVGRNEARFNRSLPLMGIGNSAVLHSRRLENSTHYPSWGLGTRGLIRAPQPKLDSLPLMGIGNSGVNRQFGLHPTLITPHGDWEQATTTT